MLSNSAQCIIHHSNSIIRYNRSSPLAIGPLGIGALGIGHWGMATLAYQQSPSGPSRHHAIGSAHAVRLLAVIQLFGV